MSSVLNPAFLYPLHPLLVVVEAKEIEVRQLTRKVAQLERQLEQEKGKSADLLAQLRSITVKGGG